MEEVVRAKLYRPLDVNEYIDGELRLMATDLIFTEKGAASPFLVIPMLGCIEVGLMPDSKLVEEHPERVLEHDAPYLLVVSYLKNPYEKTHLEMVNFLGERRDFLSLQTNIKMLSAQAKQEAEYEPPDPNSLSVISVRTVARDPQDGPSPIRRRAILSGSICNISFIGGSSKILTEKQIERIRQSVPRRYLNSNWTRLFQLSHDGKSYMTFYDKTERKEPIVLILRTSTDERIGAYVSRGLKRSKVYYGSGETFVFRFTPDYEYFPWKPQNQNQYFVTSTADEISFGGGGACAIWMDGEFLKGMSESCPTYESPGLCQQRDFAVVEVEVWHLS